MIGFRAALTMACLVLLTSLAPDSGIIVGADIYQVTSAPPPLSVASTTDTKAPRFEFAPWVLDTPNGRLVTAATNRTHVCRTLDNPLEGAVEVGTVSSPCLAVTQDWVHDKDPKALGSWRQNWNGIGSQHLIETSSGPQVIAVHSGENKHEYLDEQYCSTVNTEAEVPCNPGNSSRYEGNDYTDEWKTMNSFVAVSRVPYDASSQFGHVPRADVGPVLWPSAGYKSTLWKCGDAVSVKSSYGLRHARGLYPKNATGDERNYLYAFYQDASCGHDKDYRRGGIRVARTLAATGGGPGTWQVWCGESGWLASLPEGYDPDRPEASYASIGGCAKPILPLGVDQVHFAVARLKSGGYMGLEEDTKGETNPDGTKAWTLWLWRSDDLLNWTRVQMIARSDSGCGEPRRSGTPFSGARTVDRAKKSTPTSSTCSERVKMDHASML